MIYDVSKVCFAHVGSSGDYNSVRSYLHTDVGHDE